MYLAEGRNVSPTTQKTTMTTRFEIHPKNTFNPPFSFNKSFYVTVVSDWYIRYQAFRFRDDMRCLTNFRIQL